MGFAQTVLSVGHQLLDTGNVQGDKRGQILHSGLGDEGNSSAPYLKVSGTSKGYSKKSLRIFTLDLALWNKTWQAG